MVDSGFNTVQFSCSVVSDCLWRHELQSARLLCPPPSPEACSNSCPLSWWCHPAISPFSTDFRIGHLLTWGVHLSGVLSFYLSILFMEFSRQEYWSDLPLLLIIKLDSYLLATQFRTYHCAHTPIHFLWDKSRKRRNCCTTKCIVVVTTSFPLSFP